MYLRQNRLEYDFNLGINETEITKIKKSKTYRLRLLQNIFK